jgi:hypothetical protein
MKGYWKDGELRFRPHTDADKKALLLIHEALARLSVCPITNGEAGEVIEPHDNKFFAAAVLR